MTSVGTAHWFALSAPCRLATFFYFFIKLCSVHLWSSSQCGPRIETPGLTKDLQEAFNLREQLQIGGISMTVADVIHRACSLEPSRPCQQIPDKSEGLLGSLKVPLSWKDSRNAWCSGRQLAALLLSDAISDLCLMSFLISLSSWICWQ